MIPLHLLFRYSIFASLCLSGIVNAGNSSVHKNEQSGLLTFTSEDDGFSIELIQLLPDFVHAVYAKHDFPQAEIDRINSYCVFGSIIKNTSQQQLAYRVSDWSYIDAQGKKYPVKTKTQWLQEWQKAGIKFSWTLLPDQGVFEVGDWQQGFTTIKLPKESHFDLIYRWTLDGVAHSGTFKDLSCAPEDIKQQ
ncbi:MAG: hypothetical protein OEM07_03525 [Gammaproteobacteria bacterium]|nr:hypothetical protein [Gammaproteobacteria bacterium]